MGAIDISSNINLEKLDCGHNILSAIDLSKNLGLIEFTCNGNRISDLDLSKNPALVRLSCSDNLLKIVDVRKNLKLKYIESAPMPTLQTIYCPREVVYSRILYPVTANVSY
jgi:Leucine-rich repeat (LRR) protein